MNLNIHSFVDHQTFNWTYPQRSSRPIQARITAARNVGALGTLGYERGLGRKATDKVTTVFPHQYTKRPSSIHRPWHERSQAGHKNCAPLMDISFLAADGSRFRYHSVAMTRHHGQMLGNPWLTQYAILKTSSCIEDIIQQFQRLKTSGAL